MTAQAAAEMADRHFEAKAANLMRWIDTAEYQTGKAATDEGFRKLAAFSLHQAVETAYACFLLVHTFYFPRSHNIKFLRSLAEDVNTSLVEAWPRESRFDRRRFELLKRAYVEARYSDQYDASVEDLEWLIARARHLRDRVAELSKARIASFEPSPSPIPHPFRISARSCPNLLASSAIAPTPGSGSKPPATRSSQVTPRAAVWRLRGLTSSTRTSTSAGPWRA